MSLPSAEELVDAIGDPELGIEFSVIRIKKYARAVLETAAQLADKEGIVTGIGHAIRKLKEQV